VLFLNNKKLFFNLKKISQRISHMKENGIKETVLFSDNMMMVQTPPTPFGQALSVSESLVFCKKVDQLWGGGLLKNRGSKDELTTDLSLPTPSSIARQDIAELSSDDYWLSEKSDGVRYLLLLTMVANQGGKDKGVSPRSIMLNRAGRAWEIEVCGAPILFERSTLLDGELVWNAYHLSGTQYIPFDAITIAGRSVCTLDYSERHSLVGELIDIGCHTGALRFASKTMQITSKPIWPLNRDTLRNHQANPLSDGWILTPEHHCSSAAFGRQRRLFKLKTPGHHTIDLRLSLGKDHTIQWLYKDKLTSDPATLSNPNNPIENPPVKLQLKKTPLFTRLVAAAPCTHIIGEFKMKENFYGIEIELVRIRLDKTHPNNAQTILATCSDMKEDLCLDDLISP
jgi:hypothetical protein